MRQLLFIGLILLAVLFDLLVRWGRRTRSGARPAETAEKPIFVEEVEEAEDELGWQPFSQPQAPHPPPRSPVPPPPGAGRRRELSRWLTTPADARRGIVLMAVLGPCRGLEPPSGREPSHQAS